MTIQLKIRRTRTGETLVAEFETLEDAESWLRERPRFVDVLGTAGEVAPEVDGRLRLAMRPLDQEEQVEASAREEAAVVALKATMRKEQEAAEAQLLAQREAAKSADPDRPMHIAWERATGCHNADDVDARPVPEVVVAAVSAWVAERDSWVHPRDQYLATAKLVVWPGPIPGGDEDGRIQPGGQFTAVSGYPPELN